MNPEKTLERRGINALSIIAGCLGFAVVCLAVAAALSGFSDRMILLGFAGAVTGWVTVIRRMRLNRR